jgi:hypothetical protein
MHVEKFYPHTMNRRWAVRDNSGRVHSLWIYKADVQEIVSRLEDLWPLEPMYQLPNILDEEKAPWQS